MSAHDEQQAHHLDDLATTFRTRQEQGYTHINAVGITQARIDALEAGAAALRRASPETGWRTLLEAEYANQLRERHDAARLGNTATCARHDYAGQVIARLLAEVPHA